ncbi:class I SAM-dependent methyltransferase [Eikenella corrodens]|nr:class I SAM-dependent methyltransferase [Eikenella corrodens]
MPYSQPVRRLLDVGGNTGRWALQCVAYNPEVQVTIMDLPQQIQLMKEHTAGLPGAERIHGHPANLLAPDTTFPEGFDAIWMSQFLDCFTEQQVTSILSRAAASMSENSTLYILEPLWDRQKYETAAYCLTQTSLYFTALANGNSKIFHSADLSRCIEAAGLQIAKIHDNLGLGHSLLCCKKT